MPTHLLLASLASWFALALAWAARKRGVDLPDLTVRATGTYAGQRVGSLAITVQTSLPADFRRGPAAPRAGRRRARVLRRAGERSAQSQDRAVLPRRRPAVVPDGASTLQYSLLLCAVDVGVAVMWLSGLTWLAHAAVTWLLRPVVVRWTQRIFSVSLIALGTSSAVGAVSPGGGRHGRIPAGAWPRPAGRRRGDPP